MSNAVSNARQREFAPCMPADSITTCRDAERAAGLTIQISIHFADQVGEDIPKIAVGVVVTRSGARAC